MCDFWLGHFLKLNSITVSAWDECIFYRKQATMLTMLPHHHAAHLKLEYIHVNIALVGWAYVQKYTFYGDHL